MLKHLSILNFIFLISAYKKRVISAIAFIVIVVASYSLLKIYLVSDFNLYLGLMFLPFVLYIKQANSYSYRSGIFSIVLLLIYTIIPVLTIYYFAFCFALIFIVENTWGKVNNSIVVLIVLLGSITRYFVNVFSFSIRLELSSIAGNLLNKIGYENVVSGNVITHNGHAFSVDPECMGLKMVITAFLIMLLFVSFFERRNRASLSFLGISILSALTFVLVIVNNLMRIIALILFNSKPDTFSHEFIGLFSLFIYNIIPLYILTPFAISFFGSKKKVKNRAVRGSNKYYILLLSIITAGLLVFNISYKVPESFSSEFISSIKVNGFQKDITENNVVRLYNANSLIYIKPPARFYGSDHNPYICWQGSGYNFTDINIETIAGKEVYIAKLTNEDSQLFTSWWYDNGTCQTIGQWDWRWRTMKGEKSFSLINISCETKEQLEMQVAKLIK